MITWFANPCKLADLVVVDGNPLERLEASSRSSSSCRRPPVLSRLADLPASEPAPCRPAALLDEITAYSLLVTLYFLRSLITDTVHRSLPTDLPIHLPRRSACGKRSRSARRAW